MLRTDVNSLLEVLSGFPDIMGGIDSMLNPLLPRLETLENSIRDCGAKPGSRAEVCHRGHAIDLGRKYPKRENDRDYDSDSSRSSVLPRWAGVIWRASMV